MYFSFGINKLPDLPAYEHLHFRRLIGTPLQVQSARDCRNWKFKSLFYASIFIGNQKEYSL